MMPNMLTIRNLVEQVRRGLHIVADAPQATAEQRLAETHIRLPPDLVRRENRKRARGTRDHIEPVMVGHVTDVKGGFGVQRWGPDGWQTWLRRLERGDVPETLIHDLAREVDPETAGDMSRALALCSRYAQLPYHRLTSQRLGEVVNRPLGHRTYASDAGNCGVSMAIDCHHLESIDDATAEAGRNMVKALYYDMRRVGIEGTIRYTQHGQWSRQRWNDTHKKAHLRVYKPAIRALQAAGEAIVIDYRHAQDGGRPITTRDDPDALYDHRGRLIGD